MSRARKPTHEMIDRAVKSGEGPWEIDPRYPAEGDYEKRFDGGKGDRQILLWAIMYSARDKELVPEWAAKSLEDIMYRMAEGQFETWDDAFGKPRAEGVQQRKIQGDSRMTEVWSLVQQRPKGTPIDDNLFADIGRKLGIGGKTKVKELYNRAKEYYLPDASDN
jgi:hypothetical protein